MPMGEHPPLTYPGSGVRSFRLMSSTFFTPAARAAGAKKVELISLRDLTPLTGYVRGGCSPVGMKKSFPTFVDEMVTAFDRIYVNAGARGVQVLIAPSDLGRAADARFADLV